MVLNKLTINNLDKSMDQKLYFNPDSLNNRQIILGDIPNIFDLENIKYNWAYKLYKDMVSKRWTVEEVSLMKDTGSWSSLSKVEKQEFKDTLSFLVFMDTVQTNNSTSMADYITNPEVTLALAEQGASEALHSDSYQHIFITLGFTHTEINEIYYRYKTLPSLARRANFIAKFYQDFKDKQTLENFIKAIIADLILEGIYFYQGFMYFYLLASQGKMIGSSGIIKLINIDEVAHVILYRNILKDIIELADDTLTEWIKNTALEMVEEAVQEEILWSIERYGDGKILGFSNTSIMNYTKYIANKHILRPLKINSDYNDIKSPYKHLERVANVEGKGETRDGFFEESNSDYLNLNVLTGINDFLKGI